MEYTQQISTETGGWMEQREQGGSFGQDLDVDAVFHLVLLSL